MSTTAQRVGAGWENHAGVGSSGRAQREVERPGQRIQGPEPEQGVRCVGDHRRDEHGDAAGCLEAAASMEEQRQSERSDKS